MRNVVRTTAAVVELNSDWLNRFTRTRDSGSVTQTEQSQSTVNSDSILPEPRAGCPRLGTKSAESNGGDNLRFGSARNR